MLLSRAQDLSPFTSPFPSLIHTPIIFPMRTALSLARSISTSDPYHHQDQPHRRRFCHTVSLVNKKRLDKIPPGFSRCSARSAHHSSDSTLVEQSVSEDQEWNASNENSDENTRVFKFDASFGSKLDDNQFNASSLPSLDVKELAELPEQWRRSRLAWLCKELPAHKSAMVTRILNAQRKWVTQEDITYVAVHCMRIRENETAFRVYKWMMQQHWFKFDFSLATKLAEYMGKERKYLKCREMFDDIVNHGLVPTELTFHILVVAYLSSSARGCLEEACAIYNRMIQLGGYKPRLSLHNSLFKALVTRPGGDSKQYLNQAEFMFHHMVMSGFKIHKDIYGGLIWLHSYQDIIDKERIATLRAEMQLAGFEESSEVLVSVLRACSKEGDVEETERTWKKLLSFTRRIPSQAFVYRMEVYAKIGEPMRSLEVFRSMQEQLSSASIAAFHKIVEVLCKAQAVELAESLMKELIDSGMKPLVPSFIDLMDMYFTLNMHGDLECAFLQCLERCRPNRTIYNIYLKSLVEVGSLDKAEEILRQMQNDEDVGVDTGSCNTILRGYLEGDEHVKAKQMYDLMSQKKYNIDTALLEKLEYVLKSKKEVMKKPTTLQLSKEQREVLVGLLLGGLRIESDEKRKNHIIIFQFNENSDIHNVLNRHLHDQYHEWLASSDQQADGGYDTISQFSTISHSYFNFYADQFRPKGQPAIPKLIHRWLSPRVLAYWYMYAGYKTSSGDILLKLRGSKEDVDKIVKALQTKSLSCRVKSKGKVFWIGLLGSNSTWFWKLVNPYILDDLKDLLKPGYLSSDGTEEAQGFSFGGHSDSDNTYSVYSEDYIS